MIDDLKVRTERGIEWLRGAVEEGYKYVKRMDLNRPKSVQYVVATAKRETTMAVIASGGVAENSLETKYPCRVALRMA